MHILYKYLHTPVNMSVSESETERKTGRERDREKYRRMHVSKCGLRFAAESRATRGVFVFSSVCVYLCERQLLSLSFSFSVYVTQVSSLMRLTLADSCCSDWED